MQKWDREAITGCLFLKFITTLLFNGIKVAPAPAFWPNFIFIGVLFKYLTLPTIIPAAPHPVTRIAGFRGHESNIFLAALAPQVQGCDAPMVLSQAVI